MLPPPWGCCTKGLIGLIFPGAIIFVHILITGNWKVLRRLQIGYGVVIFLIVAVPWHVAAALANPDFLWFYFIREHLLRYLGMRYPKDYDTVPRLLFWGLLLVWLFPWSAFIWGLVRDFPRSIRPREKTAQVCLFLFMWIGAILAFYAFSTTQEYYTFPAFAAFALLLGKALADLEAGQTFPHVGPGRPCSADGRRCCDRRGHDSPRMDRVTTRDRIHSPELLRQIRNTTTSLSVIYTTSPRQLSATFHRWCIKTAAIMIACPLAAFLFAVRKRWIVSFVFLTAMMIGVCHLYNEGMIAFEPVLSSKSLAQVIQYHYRQGDKIVINDFYEKGSTINYYTGRQVYVTNSGLGVLWYGLQDKTAPKLGLTEYELLNEWTSGGRVFLFSEKKPLDSFLSRHPDFNYRLLAEDGGKKILINW